MPTDTLEIVGYFSFDCQADGYCTYGCGKRPDTVCVECLKTVPENYHPIFGGLEAGFLEDTGNGEMNCLCDLCGEMF